MGVSLVIINFEMTSKIYKKLDLFLGCICNMLNGKLLSVVYKLLCSRRKQSLARGEIR